MRLVSGLPQEGYYLSPTQGYGFWLLSGLMTYGRAELEQRANGNPVQNLGEVYSAAVQAVEAWLVSGEAPGDEYFPASLGFDNEFAPAHWP